MRKIAACDDSCPERSYLQPCKEISSGHRNAYSTLASYSSRYPLNALDQNEHLMVKFRYMEMFYILTMRNFDNLIMEKS